MIPKLITTSDIRVCRTYSEEFSIAGDAVVGGSHIQLDKAMGIAIQCLLTVEDNCGHGQLIVVARRIDAEVAPALRHFAIQVRHLRIYRLLHLHRFRIQDAHRGLIIVGFLVSIATRISYKQSAIIQGDAFGLIANLRSCHHLKGSKIYLCHIAPIKILSTTRRLALVSVASDIYVVPIRTEFTIVRDILSSSHSPTLRRYKLYDVRPVDSNGYQIVVYLNNVVWRVANLLAIHIAKPLIAYHMIILKIGQFTII